jgi:hypothetical protein
LQNEAEANVSSESPAIIQPIGWMLEVEKEPLTKLLSLAHFSPGDTVWLMALLTLPDDAQLVAHVISHPVL